MNKNLPKVKRRSKNRFKELEMKERPTKKTVEKTANKSKKKKKPVKEKIQKEPAPKLSKKQTVSEFREKGLTLIKGKAKASKINYKKLIVPIISLCIIILVTVIYFNAPTGFVEWVSTKSALSKSGSGFPVKYDVSTGKDIAYCNGQLIVATETDLKCYNKSGNEVYSRIHGFASPILKTSKMRTLVYGLGTSQYRVESASKELISDKTKSKQAIICGDISDSGVFALATKGVNEIGLVTVYNKSGREIYKYHSATEYITGVTVSENGDKICIALLSTQKAKFVSKLVICDTDETDPIYKKEFADELVYLTEYSDSSNICVLTDKRYMNFTVDGIDEEFDYKSDVLNKYEISDDYILLYTTADQNSQSGKVSVFSLTGSEKASFSIEGNVSDVSASSGDVYVLTDSVEKYDFDGEKQDTIKVKGGASKIKAFRTNAAVLYSSGIEKIN